MYDHNLEMARGFVELLINMLNCLNKFALEPVTHPEFKLNKL
jgi:hypothetical protein